MITHSFNSKEVEAQGSGLFNRLLDKLPVELHIPGYNWCGPGTDITKNRLPVNKLDEACKKHDLFYASHKNLKDRHQADKILQKESFQRVRDKDSSWKEKIAALGVTGAMYGKRKLGLGLRAGKIDRAMKNTKQTVCQSCQCTRKPVRTVQNSTAKKRRNSRFTFKTGLNKLKESVKKYEGQSNIDGKLEEISEKVLAAGKRIFKKTPMKIPRVIGLPHTVKQGGALPLIPIISAISALGGLVSGATSIVKTVKNIMDAKSSFKNNRKNFEETNVGDGLFVKPYRSGLGLFVRPYIPKN